MMRNRSGESSDGRVKTFVENLSLADLENQNRPQQGHNQNLLWGLSLLCKDEADLGRKSPNGFKLGF